MNTNNKGNLDYHVTMRTLGASYKHKLASLQQSTIKERGNTSEARKFIKHIDSEVKLQINTGRTMKSEGKKLVPYSEFFGRMHLCNGYSDAVCQILYGAACDAWLSG